MTIAETPAEIRRFLWFFAGVPHPPSTWDALRGYLYFSAFCIGPLAATAYTALSGGRAETAVVLGLVGVPSGIGGFLAFRHLASTVVIGPDLVAVISPLTLGSWRSHQPQIAALSFDQVRGQRFLSIRTTSGARRVVLLRQSLLDRLDQFLLVQQPSHPGGGA